MELLLFFMIVAVGGIWWINHTMNKKAREEAEAQLRKEKEAPYKVEEVVAAPSALDTPATVVKPEPVVEVQVQPTQVAEPVPAAPAKKPRKPAAKKTTGSKAVVKKSKPKAAKSKK